MRPPELIAAAAAAAAAALALAAALDDGAFAEARVAFDNGIDAGTGTGMGITAREAMDRDMFVDMYIVHQTLSTDLNGWGTWHGYACIHKWHQ